MLKLFVFIISLGFVFGDTNDFDNQSRIISGTLAQAGQYPWMVAITVTRSQRTVFCGGSLISENRVLTAAHCVDGNEVRRLSLNFGGVRLGPNEDNRQTVLITEIRNTTITVHEQYNPIYMEHDIAIIRLTNNIVFNDRIQRIQLPTTANPITVSDGQLVRVSGWGMESTAANGLSDRLRWADLTVNSTSCGTHFDRDIIICAYSINGNNICDGDFGSPIVNYNSLNVGSSVLVGVASFLLGDGCGTTSPAGFTRISDTSILSWINEQLRLP